MFWGISAKIWQGSSVEGSAPPRPRKKRRHCPRQLSWAEAAGIHPSPGLPKSPCPMSLSLGTATGIPQSLTQAVPLLGVPELCQRRNCPMLSASLQRKPQHHRVSCPGRNHSPRGPDPGKINPITGFFLPLFWKQPALLRCSPSGQSPSLTAALVFQRSEARSQQTASFAVVVAIDFGTTSSGYAFSFSSDPEAIHMMR